MNILIAYGGKSVEHDISVITGCLARGYFRGDVYSVYFDRDNVPHLADNALTPRLHMGKFNNTVRFLLGEGAIAVCKGRREKRVHIDVAVNCCHGLNGEDGSFSALCQLCGIPLVGSGIAPSAVAMDKILTKQMLNALGFATVEGVEVTAKSQHGVEKLGFPVIVKPALLGSSIGIKVCHDDRQLQLALTDAFRYCDRALVERALTDFTELNCAVMRVNGNVVTSAVDKPLTVHEVLTFEDKYIDGKPSVTQQEDNVTVEVKRVTADIYEKFHFGGVVRVDFLLDRSGKLFVNEINTTPGSLAYGLWELTFSRTQYGEALTEQAVADYRQMQSHVYTFDSGVLTGKGAKKK